ncbi:MAG: DUF3526 domain-containing protein [Acidobacteria bacterium]|nr:DUF3526 domain-containing protein [Acidobacteriota bacterium]
MLAQIMKYEWRNLQADRMPFAVAAILGLAIAYGAANGSNWVRFQQSNIDAALKEQSTRMSSIRAEMAKLNAGEKKVSAFADPRLPQSFGRNMGLHYVVMPPAPLGSLAVGQSDLQPYYFKVSTNSKETFVNNDEIENPVHLLAGRFDLAFAVLYLFPLVILAFSYNIVSAEKEAGTLALALSQPVGLGRLITAKVVLRAMFVFAVSILISVAGVAAGGAALSAEGALPRLLLWVGVTVLYGAFWFVLAIGMNALGRSSATNAMVLAGVWLLLVVIIPAVLNVAVKAMYPVPSRIELIQAIRVAGEESTREGSKLLARYMEDHPEMAPAGSSGSAPDFGTLLVALNDATERKVRPVLARFDHQLQQQQQFVERFRYVSPAIVAQSAIQDLAGSGTHRYQHFLAQVDAYHRRWRDYFVPRILRKQQLTGSDLDLLPQFTYQQEDNAAVMWRCTQALGSLCVPLILLGVPAMLALRRYRVAG